MWAWKLKYEYSKLIIINNYKWLIEYVKLWILLFDLIKDIK